MLYLKMLTEILIMTRFPLITFSSIIMETETFILTSLTDKDWEKKNQ